MRKNIHPRLFRKLGCFTKTPSELFLLFFLFVLFSRGVVVFLVFSVLFVFKLLQVFVVVFHYFLAFSKLF